jgi:hypothetical protein
MATAINLVYLKFSFAFKIGMTIYGSRQFQLFLNENYHEVLYLRFAALHEMYNFDIEHEPNTYECTTLCDNRLGLAWDYIGYSLDSDFFKVH